MGEVYRARDTRLDRTVAVKVLPGALAADSESRQRFEQEARVIAALNDPHICTIHDVGRHGDLDYLVLEFLEGETLEARLRRPPELQVDEALDIAVQIGTAVDRAHRAGIVHRDLKPGNVMLVRRAGAAGSVHVKLLDFGVAARTGAVQPAPEGSMTATISSTMWATQLEAPSSSGGVTGTIQYMAPEQFDGHPGDQRADIFAFGCVLYELLTGRKAFDGVNFLNVVAAIKGSEPPPNERIRSAHPMLDHVLRRCFEKDPDRRWQSIGDVAGELRWVRENPVAPPAPAPPVEKRRRVPFVASLGLGAVLGALISGPFRTSPAPVASLPSLRFEIPTASSDDPSVALSADGTQLAYIAYRDRIPMLWLRALDGTESRALAGSEGASSPFWSPDGRTLGFFADGKLKRVDVDGGRPLVITDVQNGRGGTWNRDGVILFASASLAPIMRVPSSGGAAEPATQTGAETGPAHRYPQFLPDGKRFIFYSALGTSETNGVFLASLDKTPPVRVVSSQGIGRFVSPRTLLAFGQGALQAYRFDPDTGRVEGEPQIVSAGFNGELNSLFAVSDTGVLAYRTGTVQRRQLVWVNRQGTSLGAVGEAGADFIASPELSPDERSVAVVLQRTGDNDIWVIDLARGLPHRVTDGQPADAHPLWDPDERHVVFFSRRFGDGGPTRQAVTGGTAAPLFSRAETGIALSWTRDRNHILIRRANPKTGLDLITTSPAGQQTSIVAQSRYDETEGQFSPDGRLVAFVSNDSGQFEVFVQSFPEGNGRKQVSTAGGSQVRWSNDSREIFYVSPDGRLMGAGLALENGALAVKEPVPLFQTHLASGINVLGNKAQYAVARDGRFLLNSAVESPSTPITVAVNWTTPAVK
jgi:serine/threonine protein kinase